MRQRATILRATVLATALAITAQTASADDGNRFTSVTKLSSQQEVPANDSEGRSNARISFNRDFSSARVRVTFRQLQGGVTRLHLHCNVAGANGPVALGLIDTLNPANDNSDNILLSGHRISGTITNADFPTVDPCPDVVGRPINNLVSLAAAIDAGLVYWNLHTTAVGPGELRGQVRPLDDVTAGDD